MRKPTEQELRAWNAIEAVTAIWESADESKRLKLVQTLAALAAHSDAAPEFLVKPPKHRRFEVRDGGLVLRAEHERETSCSKNVTPRKANAD